MTLNAKYESTAMLQFIDKIRLDFRKCPKDSAVAPLQTYYL